MLEVCLAEICNERDQVGETLTGDGRSGAQGHIRLRIIIFPVEASIDTLLSESEDSLVQAILELVLGRGVLGIERVTNVVKRL